MSAYTPEVERRLKQEEHALKEAVADLFIAWSEIENRMASLLNQVIHDLEIAFRIYFAPTNAETRFKIIDVCLDAAFQDTQHVDRVTELWGRFRAKLNRLKDVRNTVAHGSIGIIATPRKYHVRWTPPKFDVMQDRRNERKVRLAPRPLSGITAHDIAQSTKKMKTAIPPALDV